LAVGAEELMLFGVPVLADFALRRKLPMIAVALIRQ
jgi:hypothetical protein